MAAIGHQTEASRYLEVASLMTNTLLIAHPPSLTAHSFSSHPTFLSLNRSLKKMYEKRRVKSHSVRWYCFAYLEILYKLMEKHVEGTKASTLMLNGLNAGSIQSDIPKAECVILDYLRNTI